MKPCTLITVIISFAVVALAVSCSSSSPLGQGQTVYEMVEAPVKKVSLVTPIMAGEAARLTVGGIFSDKCTELDRFITGVKGSEIDVTVYARRPVSGCAAGDTAFTGDYYISGVPSGVYTVRVNGDAALTAQLAVIQGNSDAGAAPCQEERLTSVTATFPEVIMAGQDLVIALAVVTPDTCHSFSGIDVAVQGTGILLSVTGWACDPAAGQKGGCDAVAQTLDLTQTVSGLNAGSYSVFVNGTSVGVVKVMEAAQCASSLAPVQSVTADPASIRAGEPCTITVNGSKPADFSLAPFVEARAGGTAALTLEMYRCGGAGGDTAPFTIGYSLAGLDAGTWVVRVNDMAQATVNVLAACEARLAPVATADIYSSLYDNGSGQTLTVGTPLDAEVGGTFPDGCWTFDGFDYTLDGSVIGLNAKARYCPGPCPDTAQDFRETYTIYGLAPGHYAIVINGAKKFEFDVVQ